MKKIISPLITLLIVCTGLQSCYKDLGSYDYLDYNKVVEIKSDQSKSKTNVVLGDTVVIVPILKWKYPDRDTSDAAFEYQWLLKDEVISTERVLRYVPEQVVSMEHCYFLVTEKKTGIVAQSGFQINVSSAFSAGWTILSERGNKSVLSFVRRDVDEVYVDDWGWEWPISYKYTEYKDIYGSIFESELGNNPQKLSYVVTENFKDEILVMQKPDESVYLSGGDFSKVSLLKDEFADGVYPEGFVPKDFLDAGQCTYVLGENGEVYWKINPPPYGNHHLTRFIPMPLYYPRGSKIQSLPRVSIFDSEVVHMYDVLHNRLLLRFTTFSHMGRTEVIGANVNIINHSKPADVADINNLNDYELVAMSGSLPPYQYGPLDYTLILKDKNTSNYFLQTYSTQGFASSLNLQIVGHRQVPFHAGVALSDQSVFRILRKMPYIFFSEGSKLYFHDTRTANTKLYHDFGGGKIIKIVSDAPETELGIALDNGNLYICDIDMSVLFEPTPGASGGILHHASGLDNIVDLVWKYGGYFPFQRNSYPW